MTHRRLTVACLAGAGVAASVVGVAAGTAPAKTTTPPVITMSGSTSVYPLAQKLAKRYLKQYPRRVKFRTAQGGSDVGVSDVAKGRVSIGLSSRDAKPTDSPGLVFNKIARDAICVVTNPANPLADASQATIQNIFSGKVRDWSQVPGAGISGPIDIVVRTPASGTQDAFQKLFMGSAQIASSAAQKATNGLVQQAVKDDKQAVGYVSLAFSNGLNSTKYKGTPCTLQDAKSGAYQGTRNFWMVTRGPATGQVKTFIAWVTSSQRAAKVISTEWVPIQ